MSFPITPIEIMQDLIIIGGGVIGLSVAYFAQRAGLSVTVLERNPPESDSCSTVNAGMVVPSSFVPLAAPGMISQGLRSMLNPESPFYIRPRLDPTLIAWCWRFFRASSRAHSEASAPALAASQLDSRALFEQLAERDGLDFGLQKRGLMMLCATEEALRHQIALKPAAARLGIPVETLTPENVRALNPGVEFTGVGGVFFPLDCFLSPPLLLSALRTAVLRAGGEIRHGVEVTRWDAPGETVRAVKTSAGDVSGGQYVLAAGSWSPQTAAGLRARLPVQPGKGYSITLEQPPAQMTICAILDEAHVAITPMGHRLRVGGTMEITGLDTSIGPRRVTGIVKAVQRYLPQYTPSVFTAKPVAHGLRPCSPDGLPFVGRFRNYTNLLAATGHSMLGVSMAPVTGQLIANTLIGAAQPDYAAAFSPDRYL